MATIPAVTNDLFQCRIDGYYAGITTQNVWFFKATTPSDDAELRLILILIQCYLQHLAPGMSDKHTWFSVTWKRIYPTLSNEYITLFDPQTAGGITGDRLPGFASALMSIRTALGGRSYRGRKYIPGLPEAHTLEDKIVTESPTWNAILAFVACLAEKFIVGEAIGQNQFKLGVFSRKLGGTTFPVNPAGFTPATQVIPHVEIATTRSRKLGKGI